MHQLENQTVRAYRKGVTETLSLPAPTEQVMDDVLWGRFDELFTPAFWAERAWLWEGDAYLDEYVLGRTLREEVAACLLGGYGMPAELALKAFCRLRDGGLLFPEVSPELLRNALAVPFELAGRMVQYRFAKQKAAYLAAAMSELESLPLPESDRDFRDALLALPGVGLKTASWVTRNHRHSDSVAILDVHICRACELAGVFPPHARPEKDYRRLERCYLDFATGIGVRASVLDNLIWKTMRRVGRKILRSTTIALEGEQAHL